VTGTKKVLNKYLLNEEVNSIKRAHRGSEKTNEKDPYLCLLVRCLDLKNKEKHLYIFRQEKRREKNETDSLQKKKESLLY
jgi:hypothetical protein